MKVTRSDIQIRVEKAGARLKELTSALPVLPHIVMQVADEAELPIGRSDFDHDVVARTVFIAAFVPEAVRARDAGIDGIFRMFEHGMRTQAV